MGGYVESIFALALPSSIVISKKTFLPYIKQYYSPWYQGTISHGSKPLSSFYIFFLVSGGWVWIKISEHEHDCTAPFPHLTDSVQLHRAAALPWRFQALKAERPERGAWPLLIVETEPNGDLWSINERGPSLVGSLGSSCRYKRFYPALAALKYLFQTAHFFTLCFAIAHQPGQAVVPGSDCLLICFSG